MLANVLSSAVIGIDAHLVEVEVDIASGLPAFTTVGLPEAAVKESKERVKAAIGNSGYVFPDDRITVNLAPADIKKEGTGFDLPIALGILAATGIVPQPVVARYLVMGELSLDGRIKPVKGSLPMALAARDAGYQGIIVPEPNRLEASVVEGIRVTPVETLHQVVDFLRGSIRIRPESDIFGAGSGQRLITGGLPIYIRPIFLLQNSTGFSAAERPHSAPISHISECRRGIQQAVWPLRPMPAIWWAVFLSRSVSTGSASPSQLVQR